MESACRKSYPGPGGDVSSTTSETTLLSQFKNAKPCYQESESLPTLEISSGSCMEIRPPPLPLSVDERRKLAFLQSCKEASSSYQSKTKPAGSSGDACQARVEPQSSVLILRRDLLEPVCFSGPIKIMNSTSFMHGFMVFCNQFTVNTLSVTPKMGLISPGAEVSLKVKTNSCKAIQQIDKRCRLEVKIFRAFCEDAKHLKEYYSKLSDQHPELIRTQAFQRILIWNNGDLRSMMDLVKSIEDVKEREEVMKKVYDENHPGKTNVQTDALLNAVKNNMLSANQKLRGVFEELVNIRNSLHFSLFIAICVVGFVLILPHIWTNEVIKEPEVPKELSLFESLFKEFRALW